MDYIFAGSDKTAAYVLSSLAENQTPVLVITREDAPTGRKKILTQTPVADVAERHNVELIKTNDPAKALEPILNSGAQRGIIVSYGAILKDEVLKSIDWFNLHFSLLPKYRGAAPVQRAIMQGKTETGITVFKLDAGMDTGDIYKQLEKDVSGMTTAEALEVLAELSVPLLQQLLFDEKPTLRPQTGTASLAKKLSREECFLDFKSDAKTCLQMIRASNPEPIAWTYLNGEPFRVIQANEGEPIAESTDQALGQVTKSGKRIFVTCGEATRLELITVQPFAKNKWLRRIGTTESEKSRLVTESRKLAYKLLMLVEAGAYANIKLPQLLKNSNLSKQDRGFVQELAYGTLRMKIQHDALISEVTDIKKLETSVLNILRMGLHELLNMRTETHAAVDQAVELCKVESPKASGLVNACMRKLSSNAEQWLEELNSGEDKVAKFAHPKWIIDALSASREMDIAGDVEKLLIENNKSPKPQMVALPPSPLPENSVRLPLSEFGFESIDGLDLTNYRYQDQGSQLVTQIAAKAAPNGNWLDMCAGPGGKASLLAAIASQRDSSLTAIELYPKRADMVRHGLKGFANAKVFASDALTFDYQSDYELILIDAPCTGLGALRRKPESRHNKHPGQIQELNEIQRNLLSKASTITAKGGVIAYVTCSPLIEETTSIARWFLDNHPDYEILPWSDYSDISANKNRSTLQLWSDRDNADCMFLALFQKQ